MKLSLQGAAFTFFFLFAALCLAYYVALNCKPFTQNAFLVNSVQSVTPLVNGYVTEIPVKNGDRVEPGTLLLKTYAEPYRLAVAAHRADCTKTESSLAALQFQIAAAEASLAQSSAAEKNSLYLMRQAAAMYASGSTSQKYAEEMRRSYEEAAAQTAAARNNAAYLKAQQTILNAELDSARAALQSAEITLAQTSVFSHCRGHVENMYVIPGSYHSAGSVLFAVVSDENWKVQANFEETALARVKAGQTASVWLWRYPGRKLRGVVELAGNAVERRTPASGSAVQSVANENQWFMLPQRLPVVIKLLEIPDGVSLSLGESAYVRIETPSLLWQQMVWRFFRW